LDLVVEAGKASIHVVLQDIGKRPGEVFGLLTVALAKQGFLSVSVYFLEKPLKTSPIGLLLSR
jgi:hypothetical protein